MNEFDIIETIRHTRHTDTHTITGPGDDCAALALRGDDLCISTDTVTEYIHFAPGTEPFDIGWKAAASGLSDIAACGCEPIGITAACTIPSGRGEDYIIEIFKGLEEVCMLFDIGVSGGDLSSAAKSVTVTVTSLGRVGSAGMVLRSGAQSGDDVYVTGALGGSYDSGRHLSFIPRIHEALHIRSICEPTSMIDISDGLYSELNHISTESDTGIIVNCDAVPVSAYIKKREQKINRRIERAFSDGEDYELLFTAAHNDSEKLKERWNMDCPIHCIGQCTSEQNIVTLTSADIDISDISLRGYAHGF